MKTMIPMTNSDSSLEEDQNVENDIIEDNEVYVEDDQQDIVDEAPYYEDEWETQVEESY